MRSIVSSTAVLAIACVSCLSARAVCVDDAGVSGYHIPLEKEFLESEVILIGQVVSERETRSPPRPLDPGHTYTLEVTEVFRGGPRKRLELFAEYNSGGFPMDVGKTYLVFASERAGLFSTSLCGSAGEVTERTREIGQVRSLAAERRTQPQTLDATDCLSPEQRIELFRRTVEAVAGASIQAKLAMRASRSSAVTAQETARQALGACEARSASAIPPPGDPCAGERGEVKRTDEALAAVGANEHARIRAATVEQIRAIRSEYATCGSLDR